MTTVFVTLCDLHQFERAKQTIQQIRGRGNWNGDVILISVDFIPNDVFMIEQRVLNYAVSHIPTDSLIEKIQKYPFYEPNDNRQIHKLIQWDKLHVFSVYFKQWEKVIFLDAGIHTFNDVSSFIELNCSGSIVAPDDSDPFDNGNRFHCQVDLSKNTEVVIDFINTFGIQSLNRKYFLNCMFMFDTTLIEEDTFGELVNLMNRFPICRCNEMTAMNMYFTLQRNTWKPLQQFVGDKYTFTFCETNYPDMPHCSNFVFIKYPRTGI
jgi:hypothetical protein